MAGLDGPSLLAFSRGIGVEVTSLPATDLDNLQWETRVGDLQAVDPPARFSGLVDIAVAKTRASSASTALSKTAFISFANSSWVIANPT